MSQMINFLPESFARQTRAHQRKYRHAVLLVIFTATLAAWGVLERGRNIQPRLRALALEEQVDEARQQMSEVVKLRLEHDALVRQQQIKDELSQPISHTQIIGVLDRHLPESVGLTNLWFRTHRPDPRALEKKAGARKAKASTADANQPNEVEIELEALAPDDLTIANLIGELSENPLFDRVTMRYSRTTEARGVEGRAFKLAMRVRLDRRFEMEVADAH